MKFKNKLTLPKSKEARFALSILLFALIASIVIVFISNPGSIRIKLPSVQLFNSYKYQRVKDITDFNDINVILNSQPSVTKRSLKNFYIVEMCDFNDAGCIDFHKPASGTSNFEKIFNDFAATGLVTYTWLDYDKNLTIDKNNFFYCSLEQKPGLYQTFISDNGDMLKKDFDKEKAKEYAKDKDLNIGKFEECINSHKYKERIEKLSSLSFSLSPSSAPTLYVFRATTGTIKNIDGTSKKDRLVQLIAKVENSDKYEEDIKPELKEVIK
jgi:hypothetical protein